LKHIIQANKTVR